MISSSEPPQSTWQPLRIVGTFLTFGGIVSAIYFEKFAPTGPDGNMALASWLVFAVGMAILLVLRTKAQRAIGSQDESGEAD